VTGGMVVKKIASIKLTPQASLPPETPTISVVPASQSFPVGTNKEYQIVMNSIPTGLAGYDLVVTCSNASVAEILSISYPSWAGLSNNTVITPSSIKLSAVDVNKLIQLNATNVVLANVTVKGNAAGTTSIVITKVHMDTDGGGIITPAIVNGRAIVFSPLTADFSGTPRTGMASRNVSLDVNFTDLTTGSPNATAWHWDFGTLGNGNTSTAHNPKAHYYGVFGSVSDSSLVRLYGNHTVTLIASNAYNQSTKIRTDYIYITPLVKPFPGYTLLPTDTNGDWIMEDINGNGNLDYDDVVAYYQNMQWIRDQADVGVEPYDYNNNGRIDYDDVVVLYWIILDSHP
jgi:PKD repeat protein